MSIQPLLVWDKKSLYLKKLDSQTNKPPAMQEVGNISSILTKARKSGI